MSDMLTEETLGQELSGYGGGGKGDWAVFRVWEACFNLTHAQHLVLLHGSIVNYSNKLNNSIADKHAWKSRREKIYCFILTISDIFL